MGRQARVVAVGVPNHFTQRGNNRQDVFLFEEDRRHYLDSLRELCPRHDVTLLGCCSMPDHVHLVALPGRGGSLANALGQTHQLDFLRPVRGFPSQGFGPRVPLRSTHGLRSSAASRLKSSIRGSKALFAGSKALSAAQRL